MRIAYLSPLPPQRTGVADYSKELLPALAQHAQLDLWVDEPTTIEQPPHSRTFNYVDRPEARDALRDYDSVIYHMGNSPAHRNIYRMLLAVPGIVVLHDFVLHHFFAAYYLETLGSPASYIAEMAYNYGPAGEEQARHALHSERQIWEHEPIRYPLNKRVLDHALGVIVHSEFARRLVHQSHPHLPVAKVNLPVAIAQSSAGCYGAAPALPDSGGARGFRVVGFRQRGQADRDWFCGPSPRWGARIFCIFWSAKWERIFNGICAGAALARSCAQPAMWTGTPSMTIAISSTWASTCAIRPWARVPPACAVSSARESPAWSRTWVGSRSFPTTAWLNSMSRPTSQAWFNACPI